jgi:hypothetical protein
VAFTDVLYPAFWSTFKVNRDSMMERMGIEPDAIAK